MDCLGAGEGVGEGVGSQRIILELVDTDAPAEILLEVLSYHAASACLSVCPLGVLRLRLFR